MVQRIALLVSTNFAVITVLGVVMAVLQASGVLGDAAALGQWAPLLVTAAVLGFGGAFVSLAMSKWIAKRTTGAEVITTPRDATEAWLLDTVGALSRQVGIRTPEVAIYDSPEMNAFATGMTRDSSLVAVSTGLLRGMSRSEVEGVLAHEVAHVANGDMVTLTLVQGVVNTFVIVLSRVIGHAVDRLVFRSEREHGPGSIVASLGAQIFLGIFATMIVMWFSRWREYRADAGAARLAGREKMIAALERLRAEHEPTELPEQVAAFGIRGGGGEGLRALFRSHPPLEERIARLRTAPLGLADES